MHNCQLHLTKHGKSRMAQRGLSEADIALVIENGTDVEGGYLMRNRDAGSDKRLTRLAGVRVVYGSGSVITAYWSNRRDHRRLLKHP